MTKDKELEGKWALVTGASSGIGTAFARELAGRGAKLILTARRVERMEQLATGLRARGTEVRVVAADLTDPAAPGEIFSATVGAGLTVEILVNNAGLGQYGSFVESPEEQELAQVRVNCEAMVRLARLFVPPMVERRVGFVLVVASTASFQPVPYLTTYAATKVFDRFFAEGLRAEVGRFGVKVTALCPGPTESEFWTVSRASAFKGRSVQTAEAVAQKAVVGLLAGRRTVVPSLDGKLMDWLGRFVPAGLIARTVEKIARPRER
jgi:uncharacterized protein